MEIDWIEFHKRKKSSISFLESVGDVKFVTLLLIRKRLVFHIQYSFPSRAVNKFVDLKI